MDTVGQHSIETVSAKEKIWKITLDLLVGIDLEDIFDQVIPVWETLLRYDPNRTNSPPSVKFLRPNDVDHINEAFDDISDATPAILFENRYRHVDGLYRGLCWDTVFKSKRVYSSARDITDLKPRENKLGYAENTLSQSPKRK